MNDPTRGGFTLPGEAGYEALTLRLAEQWGADAIRDSDGTRLSDEILNAGFDIYSTICIIRGFNELARQYPHAVQQSFLMSDPVVAEGDAVTIRLLDGYSGDQFQINDTPESLARWQVFDRTENRKLKSWDYDAENGCVTITQALPWHSYTVNFLVYRVWEEISMYNALTNGWETERLMPLDPRYPEIAEALLRWLEDWCVTHPQTDVVRFTSLFYNFVWIWGDRKENANRFTDWSSYDFTVSLRALEDFEAQYGYRMTSEDFIHQGYLHATHMPPGEKQRDWMAFTHEFVCALAKRMVSIVHTHGKKAFVFYDDSWVGMEPYGPRFAEIGFDGLIKCVFSAFEARMCAGVSACRTHELRLHPYLFPTGLGGQPTFAAGGDPAGDARAYWASVRRGLLRQGVDRIGLGGYLHLTEGFPDFCEAVADIAGEFRLLKALHSRGRPLDAPITVGVLTSWGVLRTWTCAGHYHEHPDLDLLNLLESLAGLPVSVRFLDFEDVKRGALDSLNVLVNAGKEGSAWSGGEAWSDASVVEKICAWVSRGGTLIGVGEPSALPGYHTRFRLAQILGVDADIPAYACHGKISAAPEPDHPILRDGAALFAGTKVRILSPETQVLRLDGTDPVLTKHTFGRGQGIYLAGYRHSALNARFLLRTLLFASGCEAETLPLANRSEIDCAWFPETGTLVAANSGGEALSAVVRFGQRSRTLSLPPWGMCTVEWPSP